MARVLKHPNRSLMLLGKLAQESPLVVGKRRNDLVQGRVGLNAHIHAFLKRAPRHILGRINASQVGLLGPRNRIIGLAPQQQCIGNRFLRRRAKLGRCLMQGLFGIDIGAHRSIENSGTRFAKLRDNLCAVALDRGDRLALEPEKLRIHLRRASTSRLSTLGKVPEETLNTREHSWILPLSAVHSAIPWSIRPRTWSSAVLRTFSSARSAVRRSSTASSSACFLASPSRCSSLALRVEIADSASARRSIIACSSRCSGPLTDVETKFETLLRSRMSARWNASTASSNASESVSVEYLRVIVIVSSTALLARLRASMASWKIFAAPSVNMFRASPSTCSSRSVALLNDSVASLRSASSRSFSSLSASISFAIRRFDAAVIWKSSPFGTFTCRPPSAAPPPCRITRGSRAPAADAGSPTPPWCWPPLAWFSLPRELLDELRRAGLDCT
eukprot:comp21876_c0_seq1/m.49569 comp21876_c0_seq1/g.49569  ORF comp21876_c0_seq1/g.49569 comp21876_c0_seq1/m.49569 type:complete len:446 (+) comp21876_c0_seq1:647-1984(+)